MNAEASQRLAAAGQEHLVRHAESLPEDERAAFLSAAAAQPWEELSSALDAVGSPVPELRPPQTYSLGRQLNQHEERKRIRNLGQGLLAGGRVATLLLAGGQGTRLGYAGPKGNVEFGPDEGRTLYRIHAERIVAASEKYGRPVPLYVLVSAATEEATRAAFDENSEAWGLQPGQVRFLVQGTLPALDDDGRALLAAPGQLALAPDGHGGAFETVASAGVLSELRDRGVDVLTTYQVDNPLGRSLDPLMLGWMVERRLQAIGKAVRKATPDEKVGVFARDLKGRTRIVEYSELPPAPEPTPGDAVESPLMMGSIAIHGFSVRWLHDLAQAGQHLPLHAARKKVPHLDESGNRVEPSEPNATKLERFIFDLFPMAERAEVHEVKREWEFAPVKNPEGVDSLVSSRVLVDAEVRRWHESRRLELPAEVRLAPREIDGPGDA